MTLLRTSFAFIIAILPIATLAAETSTIHHWELNPERTNVGFQVNYFGNAKAVGRFNKSEGTLNYDANQPNETAVRFEVDTNSIDTGWTSRDRLLRGKNFFDSANHPTMTFESTQVEFTDQKTGIIKGNLTLHGVTRPISLSVIFDDIATSTRNEQPAMTFTANGIINRDEYGMTTYSSAIANQVAIQIKGELNYVTTNDTEANLKKDNPKKVDSKKKT